VRCLTVSPVALCFIATLPVLIASTPAAAGLSACNHLVVANTSVQGADGTGSTSVLLVNVGSRRCALEGYPSIQFYEPRYTHLVGRDVHGATMEYAAPAPKRVTLGPGTVASFGVSWSNDPQPHQACSRTQWMNVVIADHGQLSFQTSLNAVPCGSEIWVTPIEAGGLPKIP
jgi:hypothetical protein